MFIIKLKLVSAGTHKSIINAQSTASISLLSTTLVVVKILIRDEGLQQK